MRANERTNDANERRETTRDVVKRVNAREDADARRKSVDKRQRRERDRSNAFSYHKHTLKISKYPPHPYPPKTPRPRMSSASAVPANPAMASLPCARSTSQFKFNSSIAANPLIPRFPFNSMGFAEYSCGLNSNGFVDAHATSAHVATTPNP